MLFTSENGKFTASVNDRDVFSCTVGVRVVTDLDGGVGEVVGIDSIPHEVTLTVDGTQHQLTVAPNQVCGLDGKVLQAAPFDYPYRAP